MIDKSELDHAFDARFAPEIKAKLQAARIAVAGLGGLGSNIAVMLARSGVGHLKLVDFDKVDVTNLNRHPETTSRHGLGSRAHSAATSSERALCGTPSVASLPASSSCSTGASSGAASSFWATLFISMGPLHSTSGPKTIGHGSAHRFFFLHHATNARCGA